jgi:hypothetical protein
MVSSARCCAGESGVEVQHPAHLDGPAVIEVRAQRVGGRDLVDGHQRYQDLRR